MKVTGYRSLTTKHDWGRLIGDANGVMPEPRTDVHYEYVGDDHAADLDRIAEDPVTREWWSHTDPCQTRIVEERVSGARWQPLDEIWHLP